MRGKNSWKNEGGKTTERIGGSKKHDSSRLLNTKEHRWLLNKWRLGALSERSDGKKETNGAKRGGTASTGLRGREGEG